MEPQEQKGPYSKPGDKEPGWTWIILPRGERFLGHPDGGPSCISLSGVTGTLAVLLTRGERLKTLTLRRYPTGVRNADAYGSQSTVCHPSEGGPCKSLRNKNLRSPIFDYEPGVGRWALHSLARYFFGAGSIEGLVLGFGAAGVQEIRSGLRASGICLNVAAVVIEEVGLNIRLSRLAEEDELIGP